MKKIIWCLILLFSTSCIGRSKPYTIAVDKNWYSLVLDGQASFLNGFITDLLLEITKENKVEIRLISVNWDDIFDGLNKKKYEAVLSPLEPYNFNLAKFDFSSDIISTGYALVISKNQNYKSLADMLEKRVGYINGSDSLVMLQKYLKILDVGYDSAAIMLTDITRTKLDGAVLSIIPAYKYVNDLFYNDLKLVFPPLDNQAIRLITLKNQNAHLMKMFNKSLDKLKKNKKLAALKEKWQMP